MEMIGKELKKEQDRVMLKDLLNQFLLLKLKKNLMLLEDFLKDMIVMVVDF
jgi:hypothetical protein